MMGNQHDYLLISYPQVMNPTLEHLQATEVAYLSGKKNQEPMKVAVGGG